MNQNNLETLKQRKRIELVDELMRKYRQAIIDYEKLLYQLDRSPEANIIEKESTDFLRNWLLDSKLSGLEI